ncbi:MAG TPA: DUF5994 family protein [Jiangellaceae bacterium]
MRRPDLASSASAEPTPGRIAFRPPARDDRGTLDGVWWPRSRDLVAELSSVLAEVSGPAFTVSRVAYSRHSWDVARRKHRIGERVVGLGWFDSIDPNLVIMTSADGQRRRDLLVVPADSDAALAARAFALVLDSDHVGTSAGAILIAAGLGHTRPTDTHAPDADAESTWEGEGGPTTRQAA